MQSVTNPFNNEIGPHGDLLDIEWSDENQSKLDKYIHSFSPRLNYYDVYDKINWKELSEITGLNNLELIKIKVDEIYEDDFDPFRSIKEYNFDKIYDKLNIPENPFIPEVQELLESLQLESFLNESEEEPEKDKKETLEKSPIPLVEEPSTSGTRKNGYININANGIKKTGIYSKNAEVETKNPVPLIPLRSGYRLESNINRSAAICSTNNVNVMTKSEIKSIIIPKKSPSKREKRMKSVSEKIKSSFFNSSQKKSSKESKLETRPESKTPETENSNNKSVKSTRRRSMVVENLPLYIKEQLQSESPNEVIEEESIEIARRKDKQAPLKLNKEIFKNPVQGTSVGKKPSRLQNILTNSQSMYAHAKDLASAKSNDSQTATTSGYVSDRVLEQNSNNDDKVYISPNSITRAYERYQDDNDEESVLKGFQNDEIDFINLDDSLDDSIDNNENDEEDEDDKYLFRF